MATLAGDSVSPSRVLTPVAVASLGPYEMSRALTDNRRFEGEFRPWPAVTRSSASF